MKRTDMKERVTIILNVVMVLALLAVTFISCIPDLPTEEDIVITPPIPDPLPGEGTEEESELPKAWVWHLTGVCPDTLAFQIPEDESGVQILLNGKESKIVSDGDEYVILSERVRMAVKKLDGKWEVYLDGTECGYFIYE